MRASLRFNVRGRPIASVRGSEFDAWLAWRTLGGVYVGLGAMLAVWLALPHPADAVEPALGALSVLAAALGGGLLSGRGGRAPRPTQLHGLVAGVTLWVSGAIALTGITASGLAFLYLWGAPLAYWLFTWRSALAHTGLVVGTYTAALASQGLLREHGSATVVSSPLARVVFCAATVAVVGALVRYLTGKARSAADRTERSFDEAPVGHAWLDDQLRYIRVNDAFCALVDRSRDELLGHSAGDVAHPEDADVVLSQMHAVLDGSAQRAQFERRFATPDGGSVWALATCTRLMEAAGPVLAAQVQDMTARKRAEAEREEALRVARQRTSEQRALAALGTSALDAESMRHLDESALRAAARILDVPMLVSFELGGDDQLLLAAAFGLEAPPPGTRVGTVRDSVAGATLPGRDAPVVVPDQTSETALPLVPLLREAGVRASLACAIWGADRPLGALTVHDARPREFSAGDAEFLQAVADILGSARRRLAAEDELRHRASHDALTGLPNREQLLDSAAGAPARRDARPAMLVFGVDRFKDINDTLGHAAGDDLLRQLARRLKAQAGSGELVARLDGDELAVWRDADDAPAAARALLSVCDEAFTVAGAEVHVTLSAGVALSLPGADSPEELLVEAGEAMRHAKRTVGKRTLAVFDEQMRESRRRRKQAGTDLARAIERGQLRVVFQPIVSLHDGRVQALEALARWRHPQRGDVPPDVFIGLAEEYGLIGDIGHWVLEDACRRAAGWQARHGRGLGIHVNVSPRQLADELLPDAVACAVQRSGLEPGTLGLELTESTLLSSGVHEPQRLAQLGLHAKLLLDDFGTGYSSLSYLQRFAFDALKLDRSFIDGVGRDEEDSTIVRATVRMAHELGLSVVAEGVETMSQADWLTALGCEQAQGYWFARPLEADDVDELLATRGTAGLAV